jgi:predicted methyltransferase
MQVVLMIYLTKELVEEYRKGKRKLSLDLGRHVVEITSELDGVPLEEVKGDFIYAWDGKELWKLAVFDKHLYRLRMMNGKPILEIDGLRMHLVKEFKDIFDYSREVVSRLKIKQDDTVLDTCMGLGYTAMEAAEKADRVTTIELNMAVVALAKWNPWSRELFEKKRMRIEEGKNCVDFVKECRDSSFSVIIHDPPRFSIAGELYSKEFYAGLFRIGKKNARLFHYVGSLCKGKRDIAHEVEGRLEESGWSVVKRNKKLQGIFAVKPRQEREEKE